MGCDIPGSKPIPMGLCVRELENGREDVIRPDGLVLLGPNKGDYYVRVNRVWERVSGKAEEMSVSYFPQKFEKFREAVNSYFRGAVDGFFSTLTDSAIRLSLDIFTKSK